MDLNFNGFGGYDYGGGYGYGYGGDFMPPPDLSFTGPIMPTYPTYPTPNFIDYSMMYQPTFLNTFPLLAIPLMASLQQSQPKAPGSPASIKDIQNRMAALAQQKMFTEVRKQIADTEELLLAIKNSVDKIRQKNYVYKSFLEHKLSVLEKKWAEIKKEASDEIRYYSEQLSNDFRLIEQSFQQIAEEIRRFGRSAQFDGLEGKIRNFEGQLGEAYKAILSVIGPILSQISQTQQDVSQLHWMYRHMVETGFRLYDNENLINAFESDFLTDKEPIKSIIFLTEQRIICEEIAHNIPGTMLEIPFQQVENLELKGAVLEISHRIGAAKKITSLKLKDNFHYWKGLFDRVISGEIENEKIKKEGVSEAELPRVLSCPTCGARIETKILKGTKDILCEYCGNYFKVK